jgi:hypothetical protein
MTFPVKSRLFSRLLYCLLASTALLFTISLGYLAYSWNTEREWRAYRTDAARRGIILDLPELHSPIPAVENLAAAPFFAPVPWDGKGDFLAPPKLKRDWFPPGLLPSLSDSHRPDFERAWAKLSGEKPFQGKNLESETAAAFLRIFDRKMGADWVVILEAEAKPRAEFYIYYRPDLTSEKFPVSDFKTAAQCHAMRATAFRE